MLRQPQPYRSLFCRGGFMPLAELQQGVSEAGWYVVRIRAEAKFRHADMDDRKMFGGTSLTDPSQPLRLELHTGSLSGIDPANTDAITEALFSTRADQRHLATWDVPDDAPTWLECRAWLERGQFPRLTFLNGPTGSNYRLDTYVKENKYTLLDKAQLAAYEETDHGGDWFHLMFFETPRIRVHEVRVTGPVNEEWPPPSHRAIFGAAAYDPAAAGDALRACAERAWRRPVTRAEVAPIERLVRAAAEAAITVGKKDSPVNGTSAPVLRLMSDS